MRNIKHSLSLKTKLFITLIILIGCVSAKDLYVNNEDVYKATDLGCGTISISAYADGNAVNVVHRFSGNFFLAKNSIAISTFGMRPARMENMSFYKSGVKLKDRDFALTSADTLDLKITLKESVSSYDGGIIYDLNSFFRCESEPLPLRSVQIDLFSSSGYNIKPTPQQHRN